MSQQRDVSNILDGKASTVIGRSISLVTYETTERSLARLSGISGLLRMDRVPVAPLRLVLRLGVWGTTL